MSKFKKGYGLDPKGKGGIVTRWELEVMEKAKQRGNGVKSHGLKVVYRWLRMRGWTGLIDTINLYKDDWRTRVYVHVGNPDVIPYRGWICAFKSNDFQKHIEGRGDQVLFTSDYGADFYLTGFVVGEPDKGEMPVTVLNLYVVEG